MCIKPRYLSCLTYRSPLKLRASEVIMLLVSSFIKVVTLLLLKEKSLILLNRNTPFKKRSFLRSFMPLRYGNQFVVTTDHQSLKYFCDQPNLVGRKTRWAELIQDFDFTIRYCKGSMNSVADALSHIKEVNVLSFTEIKSDLLNHIRGRYLDDRYFSKY